MSILTPELIKANQENLLANLNPINKGRYYQVECPSCGHREAFSYIGSEWINCGRQNKCGEKIHIEQYLKEKEGLSEKQILVLAFEKTDGEQTSVVSVQASSVEIPAEAIFFSTGADSILSRAPRRYLESRGLDQESIGRLGYINNSSSQFTKRILIPFYENEKIVYFVARDYTGKSKLRYMNPSGVNSRDFLFNIDEVKENKDVFVVEGVMDALTMKQPTIALLTNTAGNKQAEKLFDKSPGDIIFVPDMDKAGITKLKRNIEIFLELKPPSSNSKVYIYWIDTQRRDKIVSILNKHYSREEENKLLDELDGLKDLNQAGIKYIDKKDCVEYNPFDRNLNF